MMTISEKEYNEFLSYQEKEKQYLIDNLYRAGVINNYNSVSYSKEQLENMWRDFICNE